MSFKRGFRRHQEKTEDPRETFSREVGAALERFAAVPMHALRVNENGQPAHPCRLPKTLRPRRWPHRHLLTDVSRIRGIEGRALSLHQPWAWLLSAGIKLIENRDWNTKVRGRFLVHASKAMTREEYELCRDFSSFAIDPDRFPPMEAFARGGIVGAVTLTHVLAPTARQSPWHMDGANGLVCRGAEVLPFVACRGGRRWFNVADDTLAVLARIAA